jgi:hypothetical protein
LVISGGQLSLGSLELQCRVGRSRSPLPLPERESDESLDPALSSALPARAQRTFCISAGEATTRASSHRVERSLGKAETRGRPPFVPTSSPPLSADASGDRSSRPQPHRSQRPGRGKRCVHLLLEYRSLLRRPSESEKPRHRDADAEPYPGRRRQRNKQDADRGRIRDPHRAPLVPLPESGKLTARGERCKQELTPTESASG